MEKKDQVAEPARGITVELCGHREAVAYPKVGQFLDIETQKAILSNGMYDTLFYTRTKSAQRAVSVVDAASFFNVVLPDFKKRLTVPNMMELDRLEMAEMVNQYKKTVEPWLREWEKYLSQFEVEEEETEENA